MGVGENISALRELAKVTQGQLADIAGVTRGAVSQWETGVAEPRMGAIQRIADHYHIRKADLIEDGGMDGMVRSLGGRIYRPEPAPPKLSDDEVELLSLYRTSNDQGRLAILAVARVSSGVEGQSSAGAVAIQ